MTDQFKLTVDNMIDFLQKTPRMSNDDISHHLLKLVSQSDLIHWDVIAQSLGLSSFLELIIIYNMYN